MKIIDIFGNDTTKLAEVRIGEEFDGAPKRRGAVACAGKLQ